MHIIAELTQAQVVNYRKLLYERDLHECGIDVAKSRHDYAEVAAGQTRFHLAENLFQDFCYQVISDISKKHRDDFPDEISWWFRGRVVFLQWNVDDAEKWKNN